MKAPDRFGTEPMRAKLFWNGRSQAVRLPKIFRFEGQTEVSTRREGDKVILEPVGREGAGLAAGLLGAAAGVHEGLRVS